MMSMKKQVIEVGKFVEFPCEGLRLGRVLRIRGSFLTVALWPYGARGKKAGKRVRVHKEKVLGVVYRKKVRPIDGDGGERRK